MNRADRDYEKLKAFADQLRKENKKLQEQIKGMVFAKSDNEVSKRIYETEIRNLRAVYNKELERIGILLREATESRMRRDADCLRLTDQVRILEGRLGMRSAEPRTVKRWDGIRKIYIDD